MPERPILIAYGGSEDARSAVTRAGELPTPGRALVVTVWPAAERLVNASAGAATYAPIFGEIDELERTSARAAAEQAAALAGEVGVDASPARGALRSERVARDPRFRRRHDAGAIVVGSHGPGGLTVVLLGSVSSRVVHHADRPVLVVRPKRSS